MATPCRHVGRVDGTMDGLRRLRVRGPKDVLVPLVFGAWELVHRDFANKLLLLEDKDDCTVDSHLYWQVVIAWVDGGELTCTGVNGGERKTAKISFGSLLHCCNLRSRALGDEGLKR